MTTAVRKPHSQIGRFFVLRKLEQAAHGAAFLATDTETGRRVVVKTVESAVGALQSRWLAEARAQAARRVAGLSHPNIVPFVDSGEHEGVPYYAQEFAKGQPLPAWMGEHGRFEVVRAVEIVGALCQAVAHAHERDVFHPRLGADSVLMTSESTARLLDFGLSACEQAREPPQGAAGGDAPAAQAPRACLADVRGLAAILYEMITGVRPDALECVTGAGGQALAAPSRMNALVDEQLDGLLLRALSREPGAGFGSVPELATALAQYLDPSPPQDAAATPQGTLDYLLRRIRHKGDFPALSATITAVNRAAQSDREPVAVLCNSILRDIALTSRLLKIVNGSHLIQFGGSVSTVSRAVAILGYKTVRNVSMSLLLFEHLHDRANAAALKDRIIGVYFSGLLARELSHRAGIRDPEQAFVCAMFHRLGSLLATFYLHDEAQIVARHMQSHGWSEERAAREVLGISYEELGVGVSAAWNFPEEIVQSMRPVSHASRGRVDAPAERLRLIAGLANELAEVVQTAKRERREEQVAELVSRYGGALGVGEGSLSAAIRVATDDLRRDADSLGHGVACSSFMAQALAWRKDEEAGAPPEGRTAAPAPQPDAGPAPGPARAELEADPDDARWETAPAPAAAAPAAEARTLVQGAPLASEPAQAEAAAGGADGSRRHAAMSAGIQEITNTLVGEHPLNDVLRVILETMLRTVGFGRVLLFVLDARRDVLRCRFGFGNDADAIVQDGIAMPARASQDLFSAAVQMGADVCIENLDAERVRPHIPRWYRDAIRARGIVLLPIVHRKRTLGLIYADSNDPRVLRFTPEELGLLKTLRNQALLAMRSAQ
jgi:HD-like signal output (HDOD) protein